MANTRKFNGITYKFGGSFPSKSSAQHQAKYKRDRGFNARLVKENGGYTVYVN